MANFLPLDFFQRALLAGVMLSLLCGMLSVFVILRRMAFIGVGISHSAFGGVALGFLLGPVGGSLLVGSIVGISAGYISRQFNSELLAGEIFSLHCKLIETDVK